MSRATPPTLLKIVVAGGFGVGKTTLVGAVSEIPPLTTEEYLTEASSRTDPLAGVEAKSTTTVAMDFGRITFDDPQPMVLYLFGTPGQDRFLFTWDDLAHGAVGAVIPADTRRLADSFTAVGYFEQRGLPFVIAVNQFDNAHRYTPDEVRHALELPATVPVLLCDARQTRSAATVLITLVRHALATLASSTTGIRS
ncbi:GTP-binding protein [Streptacidiphilus griseoplanus]|uniref:GTP-binding protein n=1 Tax=Peterkaempfera griseoplana TaxID=66896 RepID=UPI0006E14C12|nr:ATP/GTP-binding protein [Peterkaempfera griseoplana]